MILKPPDAVLDTATAHPIRPAYGALATAAILLAFLAPFLFYFDTAKSIVAIWNSSETFAHGYIILPISLWLIWRRRANFAILPPQPLWPALLLLAAVTFGWLLARMGDVQVVMQYSFVAMLPVIALAILGRRLAWSLAFPLLFLLLAVPFGEIFIEPLIAFTADFTVWALQTTGIPVLRSGSRFEIPTGSWSVVEACSGVRYLISSVTLGCLYAYLTYRSAGRRALFMLASIIVPIVANGMRAYMIVMIGHLSGMKLAVGVDHLIYGWLFFGLVMFLLFWIGTFWREDAAAAPLPDARPSASHAPAVRGGTAAIVLMTLAVAVTAGIAPLFARYADQATFNPAAPHLGPVDVTWQGAPAFTSWKPRFAEPDDRFSGVFRAGAEPAQPPVILTMLYYRNQRIGKTLISSTNRLVGEKDEAHQLHATGRAEQIAGRPFKLRESTILSAGQPLLVWQWNWIGGVFSSGDYAGKLLQAREKLLLHGDDAAAVLVSAPFDKDPEDARRAMRAFLQANLPAIDRSLAAARAH